jgi:hypothetical protein
MRGRVDGSPGTRACLHGPYFQRCGLLRLTVLLLILRQRRQ